VAEKRITGKQAISRVVCTFPQKPKC